MGKAAPQVQGATRKSATTGTKMADRGRRPVPPGRVLPPIRPNAGLEADYRRRLERLVGEMHGSLTYWLTAAYRARPPEMAADASPARVMQAAFNRLARRWERKIDVLATATALHFGTAVNDRNEKAIATLMRTAGWTVSLKQTAAANDVLQATIAENVSLIKSIGQQHLSQVERLVMQSVQQGRDIAWLTDELEGRYAITRRRAALIARDQSNKATAAIQRVRYQEVGIEQALWMHSHGGKHPRPSHVAHDGKVFDIREGALIDGKRIWPGTEINCRCVCRPVLPKLHAD